MSDHDAAPEPIDKAYAEAEAMLSNETARAARRERVLAAVARRPISSPTASSSARRPRPWRRGGWLVAASVAGLGLILTAQLYRPIWPQPHSAPRAPTAPNPAAHSIAASPSPLAAATARAPPPASTFAAALPGATPTAKASPPPGAASPTPALREAPPAPAPPAALSAAPAPQAFPSAKSAPPPPESSPAGANQAQSLTGGVDTRAAGEAQDRVVAAEKAESHQTSAPVAIAGFRSSQRDEVAVERRDEKLGAVKGVRGLADPGARLRAAAAAGHTKEAEALLDRGAPVDAPDAEGDTALMRAIKADQPAAAALLRRHGASLDSKNNAGKSARDMAAEKGDAKLNQAIGLAP